MRVGGTLVVHGMSPLRGRVRVPGDKSISHRGLILAAMASGTSTLGGLSDGDDVARTRAAIEALGAEVSASGPDQLRINGGRLSEPGEVIDCGNSGTGIRLLVGMLAGRPGLAVLTGDESIRRRPMDRVVQPLRQMGARIDGRADGSLAPLVVRGAELSGIDYEMPVASAQVKSAILLAGLSADGPTRVHQPRVTRAHTEEMLAAAGVDCRADGLTVHLQPGPVQPFQLEVPGDPSQAAFWLVGASIVAGSDVEVERVYLGPARGGFLEVLERMGADLEVDQDTIRVRSAPLRAAHVAADEVPGLVDEIPILAVAALAAEGTSIFDGIEELRVKESDRVATTLALVRAFGGVAEVDGERLVVEGAGRVPRPGVVDCEGDHRIAMATAIAGLATEGASSALSSDAIATSYPGFGRHLRELTR